ncbi:hypothetical protein F4801DRAFT_429096 [Xylaria longipes]|nr:hypothetical protein F4801DRAFT_429096 [Xylaria longipes]
MQTKPYHPVFGKRKRKETDEPHMPQLTHGSSLFSASSHEVGSTRQCQALSAYLVLQCDDSGNFLPSDLTTYTFVLRFRCAANSVPLGRNGFRRMVMHSRLSPKSCATNSSFNVPVLCMIGYRLGSSLQYLSGTPRYLAECRVLIRRTAHPKLSGVCFGRGTIELCMPPIHHTHPICTPCSSCISPYTTNERDLDVTYKRSIGLTMLFRAPAPSHAGKILGPTVPEKAKRRIERDMVPAC